MTAICPAAGPSNLKAGYAPSVTVDVAYMQSLLPAGLAWAVPYLPYMRGLVIGDTAAFCALDPPTWTVPTSAEILEFLTGGPIGAYLTVNEFLANITKAYLWYTICECTGGGTPSAPAAPSPPADYPVPNPPDVVLPPGQPLASLPCARANDVLYSSTYTTDGVAQPVTAIAGSVADFHWGPYSSNAAFPLLAVNTIRLRTRRTQVGAGPHQNVTWRVRWQTQNNFLYNTDLTHAPDGVDHVYDLVPAPGATNVIIQFVAAAISTDTIQESVEAYCNVPPGTVDASAACCPPDPTVLAMLARLQQTIDLIQRQHVPFSYVFGDDHAGLTGDGELAVQGLLGVALEMTVLPPSYGQEDGTPVAQFGLGWITFGTADGWEESRRIGADTVLVFPAAAGLFTRVGYTLSAGVEATITELVREP